MVRALAAAACVTTAALSTAVLPAFPQSVPRFPTFEISATTETFHATPAAVRLKPSSAAQAEQSAAEGEWLELSYSAPDLSDQLVSFSPIGNGTLPVVCGTAPPDAAASRFAACSAFVAPSLGDWAFSFQSKAWNGAVDSDGWRLNALLNDVTVAAASDLSTPLDPSTPSPTSASASGPMCARWQMAWDMIAASAARFWMRGLGAGDPKAARALGFHYAEMGR